MARGTSLTTLIQMLRAEAGHSTSVAAGIDNEAALIQKIQRVQAMLYDDYDWPFLRDDWSFQLEQGQQFYDLPVEGGFPGLTALNSERIEEAWIDYSGRPIPIDRGIGQPQYAQYNSAKGEAASPARRWDIKRSSDTKEQIEIWPIPTDDTNTFWLRGIKKLRPLVAPADVADIDDILIVLTAAHEILARQKSADASKVEAAAARRLAQLKGRTKGGTRMINLAGSNNPNRNLGKTIIRIGSQTNA